MHKQTVIDYFGNQVAIAGKLGLSEAAISRWGEVIPEKQALKLNKLTRGRLKYNPSLYV